MQKEDLDKGSKFTDEDMIEGTTWLVLIYYKIHWIVFAWSLVIMFFGNNALFSEHFFEKIIVGLIVRLVASGAKGGEDYFHDFVFLGQKELTVRCFKASCLAVAVATPFIIYYSITDESYHYGFWRYIQSAISTIAFGIAA